MAEEQLDELVLKTLEAASPEHRPILERMVDWLSEHDSEEEIVNAIRESWIDFGSPLEVWAQDISKLNLRFNECGIQLEIKLRTAAMPVVYQAPPMERDRASQMTAWVAEPIRAPLIRLLTHCPCLSVKDQGVLADERYLVTPMANVENWVSILRPYRHQWDEAGAVFPEPRYYQAELLQTALGDYYVFDKDARIYFFDHEENTFAHCVVDPEILIAMYLKNQDSIICPDTNGWTRK